MTTLGEIKTELYKSLGGRDDTEAQTWITRGINAGIMVHALMNEPPELKTFAAVVAPTDRNGKELTAELGDDFIRIEQIYNTTGGCAMYRLPFHMLEVLNLPTGDTVQYYAVHGNYLHARPITVTVQSLQVFYVKYPDRLVSDSDTFPFATGLELVMAIAHRWAWAAMEETDDEKLWSSVSEALGAPETSSAKLRAILGKEFPEDLLKGGSENG